MGLQAHRMSCYVGVSFFLNPTRQAMESMKEMLR